MLFPAAGAGTNPAVPATELVAPPMFAGAAPPPPPKKPMAYPSRIEKFDPVVDDSHHTPPVGQNASKVSPAPAVNWMPWVVVGAKPIPIVTVLVAMFWTRRYLREE